MASAQKKARTEGEEKKEEVAQPDENKEEVKEPEPPKELEEDDKGTQGPKIKDPVTFFTEDTTMNCLPTAYGKMFTPLTDGGFQYLLAGARASVGITAARYMFEVKIVENMTPAEDPAGKSKMPPPRNLLRVGLATAGASLFVGDDENSICFDTEGAFMHDKKKEAVAQKFGRGDVIGILVNLDTKSQNTDTVSLFKNGVRACPPQLIPKNLIGQTLFPAFTFKNLTLHYNFGPVPLAALPFKCRMWQEAGTKHVTVKKEPAKPKDAKYHVMFPVSLPNEGTFDWLDLFLESNKQYTELSDREILKWAEKSGLPRPKGYGSKTSNDKPEMGFGVPMLDDNSIRRVIQAVAPIQQRNYVVMEVKSNLVKEERKEQLAKWGACGFKRTACVMMGEPPGKFKQRSQELALKAKQEASNAEFAAKKVEEKRQKLIVKRQKQLEKEKKKAEKVAKKKQEALKAKLEFERRKREATQKGETFEETLPEEKAEEKDSEGEEPEDEEMEDVEEKPPSVQLTSDEKKQWFRKQAAPDLVSYAMSTSFTKFSIPSTDEGFDDVNFEWYPGDACQDYLKQWVRDRKLTTRVEDLQPSDWFMNKLKDWQKTLQSWHQKQNQYKALVSKKAAEAASKVAAREAELKKKEAASKAIVEAKTKEAEEKRKAGDEAAAKKAEEEKDTEEKRRALEIQEDTKKDAEAKNEKDKEPAVDFDRLDIFGVEDILDIGDAQPIFSAFAIEDWTMLGLRFEIHLLAHAFRRDVNDPDRAGIHAEHLAFYYNKYFKKTLTVKMFGVETIKELLDFIKDTVIISGKNQVVQPLLPDDMESLGVFAMLTEEARRDRTRRVDLGDESARLKLATGAGGGGMGASPAASGAARFGAATPGVRPAASPGAWQAGAAAWQRPMAANGMGGPYRPPAVYPGGGYARPGGWPQFGR